MKTLMIAFLLFYVNVDNSGNTLSKELTQKWMMYQVLEGEQDVTKQHNPNQDRYIWFKEDGTFESGGTPYGKNTGQYKLNAEAGTIFLDSDAGEGDDSHWRLTLEGEQLIMQGIGTPRQESFQLIFVKAEK
jgi:hypothetical protein